MKLIAENINTLKNASISKFFREGRIITLQNNPTNDPVKLDDIRPIVVRSHISKIIEKAILAKVREIES
jgi:hypothetical protein